MAITPQSTISTPLELQILSYLQHRMKLSTEQNLNYKNLLKGYEGERKLLDILEKHLSSRYIIISDLLLNISDTEFQLDILIIGNNKVYPLEVKNYDGDFYIEKDNWYAASSKNEIRNPLHQLKRSELLLQRFLRLTRFNFSIEPYIIFINSEFFLYEATINLPIIFPTQINRFIGKLNATTFKQKDHHQTLANTLINHRLYQSSYRKLPDYEYENVRKGIICSSCSHFLTERNYNTISCRGCDNMEGVDSAIQRSIIEFSTLFPNKKITTNIIYEWCHVIESKKTIRRILNQHMTPVGIKKHTYYIFK